MNREPLAHDLRSSAAYRADRLEQERDRLHRRLVWATHRGDKRAVGWLEKRLDSIEQEMDADMSPGRRPGRHDSYRPR